MKQVVGDHGILHTAKEDDVVRYGFNVLLSVLPPVGKYADIILTDAAHHVNCGVRFYGTLSRQTKVRFQAFTDYYGMEVQLVICKASVKCENYYLQLPMSVL